MKTDIIQEKQKGITTHTFKLVKNKYGLFDLGDILCAAPDHDGLKIRQLLEDLPEKTEIYICVTVEE